MADFYLSFFEREANPQPSESPPTTFVVHVSQSELAWLSCCATKASLQLQEVARAAALLP
jgi:hypothetical protein